MAEKKLVPLYAEHIRFLVTRVGSLVTNIDQHFTFKQAKYKKDFVVIKRKSRQKAISPAEDDIYKLLNKANFGIDCRNNIDNCHFEHIYDEISEIAYIKQFDSIFGNKKYREFSDISLTKEEVNKKCNQSILALDKNDPKYEAKKYSLESSRDVDLDSVNSISAHRKKSGKKRIFMR